MFLSPSAQQALRALIYLAQQDSFTPVLAREIAAAEDVPHPFLSKLLHRLRNRGIVKSRRGPGGGYALARPPERIALEEVVETFDGVKNPGSVCILGLEACGPENPCALHERWSIFRQEFHDKISSLTLLDIAQAAASTRAPIRHPAETPKHKRTARSRKRAPQH